MSIQSLPSPATPLPHHQTIDTSPVDPAKLVRQDIKTMTKMKLTLHPNQCPTPSALATPQKPIGAAPHPKQACDAVSCKLRQQQRIVPRTDGFYTACIVPSDTDDARSTITRAVSRSYMQKQETIKCQLHVQKHAAHGDLQCHDIMFL